MITVIGKWRDVSKYEFSKGYNVMPLDPDWTPERNRAWIDAAIDRGDKIMIASSDVSGEFKNELRYLLEKLTA
jgi:hypothetical protein